MALEKIEFEKYCYQYPFSKQVLNDLKSTINCINPQDTKQTFNILDNIENLPVKNVQLILIPNKLSIVVYQSKTDQSCYNFGFFESINDQSLVKQCIEFIDSEISNSLELVGPVNFSTFFNYRLKLNCFDRPSFLGEPNNLAYYPTLLESAGFSVDKTYHSQYSSARTLDKILDGELNGEYLDVAKQSFDIKPISSESITDYIEDIYDLVVGQFKHKTQFNAISMEMFSKLYVEDILPYIHSRYSFVYYFQSKLAGFNFMFDHKQFAEDHNLDCSDNCSDLIYKTVCVHKSFQGKGLFKLMNANTLSQYPYGISTTGATMENSQFVLNYSDKYGEVKTIDYALYKRKV